MSGYWEKIKKNIEKTLKSGIFHLWIKPLDGELQDNTLFLYSPNDFITSWVKDRLIFKIKEVAENTLGKNIDISISTRSSTHKQPQKILKKSELYLPIKKDYENKHIVVWRHTFNDFVVGPQNQLAYAACKTICTSPKIDFGSLFLSSSPGLGKTHLIHSIGNFFSSSQNREIKMAYISSEQFANQLVWALKTGEMNQFKKFYRENVDLLLLEDIHFFQGKEKMQEELLFLIKAMEEKGKLVIFSSSFLPKELKDMDPQLTSYFCSGLIAPIEKPDFNLRMKIIEKKATIYQVNIPETVSKFIASKIKNDIRQLESCIKNMALKAKFLNTSVNMDLAKEVIQNHVEFSNTPSMQEIIKTVCSVFELSPDLLRSKSKKRNIVVARNSAFYLARKFTDLSLKEIGKHFNRRHSTVIKGITNIEREIHRDTPVGRQLIRLVEKFEN
jgi:chromosomal replication initiator protein